MLNGSEEKSPSLQSLSALVDGELDSAAVAEACAQWRGDAGLRSSWHAYHLIGDVMRSEELASGAKRDASFRRRLAERLAAEPVVLAPQPTPAPAIATAVRGPRRSWLAPAAVAAGLMAVASVLVVTGGASSPLAGAGDLLAGVFGGKEAVVASGAPDAAKPANPQIEPQSEPQTLVADGQMLRDARLDRYVTAHKQFGGSSALGAPSGFLRAATTQTPDR